MSVAGSINNTLSNGFVAGSSGKITFFFQEVVKFGVKYERLVALSAAIVINKQLGLITGELGL